MRLSVNLDEDLYRIAKALAASQDCSISTAVNRLIRAGFESGSKPEDREKMRGGFRIVPQTGLPVSRGSRPVKADEVRRAEEDEDLRHWTPQS